MRSPTADVVVVGAGVIGLAAAWRLSQRGQAVTVVDPAPGSGASRAAAGLLAPVSEAHFGEERLLGLNLAAARAYPDFVAELSAAGGADPGYRPNGTLVVAADTDDRSLLVDLYEFHRRLGLRVELLTGRECRDAEPALAPSVRAGLLVPDDHSVDNRRLTAALLAALRVGGVTLVTERVAALEVRAGRATGVRLATGDVVSCGAVVLAAGCWSSTIPGVPAEAVPVRPVKGQILRLQAPAEPAFITRNVRGLVHGSSVYLVPRTDGEIVVGATVEEVGFDTTLRAGAAYELVRDARALLPDVTELTVTDWCAGLRPGSPDNAPLVGPLPVDGLFTATGHYRNGILLAPVTAAAVAEVVTGGSLPAEFAAFGPDRFAAAAT